MQLFVDIGNSRIKWLASGRPSGNSLAYAQDTLPEQLAAVWKDLPLPDSVYVANVAGSDAADRVCDYCRSTWGREPVFLSVTRHFHELVNAYEDTGQMGVDRWLALVAGWSEYRDNLCIVDFGTAITVDLVLADGRHLGGYILPGTRLMGELLNRRTRGVRVSAEEATGLFPGKSTGECLGNGTRLAVVALIERVVSNAAKEYGSDFRCIITGGDAAEFREWLSPVTVYVPDLVLQGMVIVSGDEQ